MPIAIASLPINSVNTHPDLQMRADELLSEDHLADVVEALKERDLPRITCAKVYGRVYVTDGHYRLAAYQLLNTLFTLGERWSTRKIAEIARVSHQTVANIESAHTPVKIDVPQEEVKTLPIKTVTAPKPAQPAIIPQNSHEIKQLSKLTPEPSFDEVETGRYIQSPFRTKQVRLNE